MYVSLGKGGCAREVSRCDVSNVVMELLSKYVFRLRHGIIGVINSMSQMISDLNKTNGPSLLLGPRSTCYRCKPRLVLRKTQRRWDIEERMHHENETYVITRKVTYIELQPGINQHLAGSPDSRIPQRITYGIMSPSLPSRNAPASQPI